jgi:hypothetical protein
MNKPSLCGAVGQIGDLERNCAGSNKFHGGSGDRVALVLGEINPALGGRARSVGHGN